MMMVMVNFCRRGSRWWW